jgi:integrase
MPRRKPDPPPPEPKRHAHRRGTGSQKQLGPNRFRAWRPQVAGGTRESRTFGSEAEATAWRLGLAPEPQPGPAPGDQLLSDYLQDWIERQSAGWPPGTAISRRATIKHAAPVWHRPVRELVPSHARECVAAMQRRGLTNRYARAFLGLLRMALEDLVEDGVLARNPVPRPKRGELPITEPPRVVWSREDLARWLAETYRHPWGVVLRIAARRGMRPAEFRGLKWADIRGSTLTLRRNLNEGRREAPTKNKKPRVLTLLPEEVAELREHRQAQTVVSEWVVCREDGRPPPVKLWGVEFEKIRLAAGVAPATPRVLRHTAATLLSLDVQDMRAVSAILGHSTPGFTWSRYGSPTDAGFDRALDVMAAMGGETAPESGSAPRSARAEGAS